MVREGRKRRRRHLWLEALIAKPYEPREVLSFKVAEESGVGAGGCPPLSIQKYRPYLPGELERFEIRERFKFRFKRKPIQRYGKYYEGWVNREKRHIEIYAERPEKIPEIVEHELLHYKVAEPLFPIEDFLNKLVEKIRRLMMKHQVLKKEFKGFEEQIKAVLEKNYVATEKQLMPFLLTKYVRPGTITENEVRDLAEEELDERFPDEVIEREDEVREILGLRRKNEEDAFDIKG